MSTLIGILKLSSPKVVDRVTELLFCQNVFKLSKEFAKVLSRLGFIDDERLPVEDER